MNGESLRALLVFVGTALVGVLGGFLPEHKYALGWGFGGIIVLVAAVRWELEAGRNARAWRKEKEENAKKEKGKDEQ